MNDAARVECRRQVRMIALCNRRLEQRIERIAMREAQAVVGREGHAARHLDPRDGFAEPQRGDEVHPLARGDNDDHRSEEQTSELQSLMRNSYAVFCLKK